MTVPREILDACRHGNLARAFADPDDVCRACAERAIDAARREEREACIEAIERNADVCTEANCGHERCEYAGRFCAAIEAARGAK